MKAKQQRLTPTTNGMCFQSEKQKTQNTEENPSNKTSKNTIAGLLLKASDEGEQVFDDSRLHVHALWACAWYSAALFIFLGVATPHRYGHCQATVWPARSGVRLPRPCDRAFKEGTSALQRKKRAYMHCCDIHMSVEGFVQNSTSGSCCNGGPRDEACGLIGIHSGCCARRRLDMWSKNWGLVCVLLCGTQMLRVAAALGWMHSAALAPTMWWF